MDENNKYTKMQKDYYDLHASNWNVDNRDEVVGTFDLHNDFDGYENLFKNIPDQSNKVVLDFGCGPGRNLVRYNNRFKRIDGVDISEINLEKARVWLKHNNIEKESTLYKCDGTNLSEVPSNSYDIVMSTICMQHICVHEIRFNYLKEFYRVLKEGGHIAIQMGYDDTKNKGKNCTPYFENNYNAGMTNGGCDTVIADPNQVKTDLDKIGFKNFTYTIGDTGPGDGFTHWFFFNGEK